MKKVLIVLVAISIIASASLFALDTGTLTVNGYILAPELSHVFTVTEVTPAVNINLKDDVNVHSGGNGVKVGSWTLVTNNHVGTESYTLEYVFGPLTSATTSQSLAYTVVEMNGTVSASVATGDETTYEPASGNTSTTRDVRVKLTADATTAVATADPASDFTSTITINLTSGS